ncbi:uncharacterized protein L201_000168 [Kwoniella dendrophila CBS 6074]|uniref:Uncharacterized protein n=1 Tax=Kwoniella dendrophila CBS 6074 TaxID=1295534 RepID=A0AAX4JIL0_9TREE
MFRKPPVNPVLTPNCSLSPAPDQDQSTVLVIHNLNDLQKKSNETRHPDDRVTLLEEWLKILENPHHRTNLDPFPTRLSPKLDRNKEERFGPWGMMELASDDSASFVDIENSIESIVVRFIN